MSDSSDFVIINNGDKSEENRRTTSNKHSSKKGNTPIPLKFSVVGCGGVISFFLVSALMIALPIWIWYGWRIEPDTGQVAILIRKTGKTLPVDQIIANEKGYKGIQQEVLAEGRYFYNPYVWDWQYAKAVNIPAGKFGIVTRLFGKDLPYGEVIAPDETYKGIVKEVLGTGLHRINPYAYKIEVVDDIRIPAGHVGVKTLLAGKDMLNTPESQQVRNKNPFLVQQGHKGVLQEILPVGTHRINPYIYSVSVVNLQSQRFEISGEDAIVFRTIDGFPITIEGTIEFNLDINKIAQLTHEIGDMDDVIQKLILPSAHGFFRIEGSKKMATDFIIGETRQAFQDKLAIHLKKVCLPWGISLNSVLIRDIITPQEIAKIIRHRELATQEIKKIDQKIIQAQSSAELEKQKMLAEQNKLRVKAETESIQEKINAEQRKLEQVIAAETNLKVIKIQKETAFANAQSVLTIAQTEANLVTARAEAEAKVLKEQLMIYGDQYFLRAKLNEKIAPAIESIMVKPNEKNLLGLPLLDPNKE